MLKFFTDEEIIKSIKAVVLSPAITILIIFIFPHLIEGLDPHRSNNVVTSLYLWIIVMMVALPFTFIYGILVSSFLRSKNNDDYFHYGIAGFVPSVIWLAYLINSNELELLSIDSLLWLFGGTLCAVLFRYFRGGVSTELSKADHKP